jgi:hypothetical protein
MTTKCSITIHAILPWMIFSMGSQQTAIYISHEKVYLACPSQRSASYLAIAAQLVSEFLAWQSAVCRYTISFLIKTLE